MSVLSISQLMKQACLVAALLTVSVCMTAQTYTKQTSREAQKAATKWVKKGEWRNGFTAAKPDKSVNLVKFREQYFKNKAQWDAMFQWLASTDLLAIPKGRHKIGDSGLVASVEDSKNDPLEKRKSESHRHHIDFQYVVKGSERFGILEHESSRPSTDYKSDIQIYDYELSRTRFYDSTPKGFFLFFPDDWHIAKVMTDKPDQTIRVIVIKLDYVE
ncbi:MAG: YhcH/YjgK/YiaL family protein [Bacteroides sp.]